MLTNIYYKDMGDVCSSFRPPFILASEEILLGIITNFPMNMIEYYYLKFSVAE